jgi:hypothetical protein
MNYNLIKIKLNSTGSYILKQDKYNKKLKHKFCSAKRLFRCFAEQIRRDEHGHTSSVLEH